MTRAATAELALTEAKTVPRVGYLVYRVQRWLRASVTPKGLEVPAPCAHSLETTNPPPRLRPLGGTR